MNSSSRKNLTAHRDRQSFQYTEISSSLYIHNNQLPYLSLKKIRAAHTQNNKLSGEIWLFYVQYGIRQDVGIRNREAATAA